MRSCGSSLNRDTVKEEVDEGSSNISKIIVCFTIPTQSLPPTPFPPPRSLRFERGRQAGGRRHELLPAAAALLSLVGAARPQIVQQDLLGVAVLQEEDDGRRLGEALDLDRVKLVVLPIFGQARVPHAPLLAVVRGRRRLLGRWRPVGWTTSAPVLVTPLVLLLLLLLLLLLRWPPGFCAFVETHVGKVGDKLLLLVAAKVVELPLVKVLVVLAVVTSAVTLLLLLLLLAPLRVQVGAVAPLAKVAVVGRGRGRVMRVVMLLLLLSVLLLLL